MCLQETSLKEQQEEELVEALPHWEDPGSRPCQEWSAACCESAEGGAPQNAVWGARREHCEGVVQEEGKPNWSIHPHQRGPGQAQSWLFFPWWPKSDDLFRRGELKVWLAFVDVCTLPKTLPMVVIWWN